MKRITLLLLLFLLTGSVAYSQLPQDFEGGIPAGWTRYNNAFGAAQWATINAVTTPPTVCEGTISAFVNGNWHSIYDYALENDFRFLSYGDSSLLL